MQSGSRLAIINDGTMIIRLKNNMDADDNYLHLYVEILQSRLHPLIESCVVDVGNGSMNIDNEIVSLDDDDISYAISNEVGTEGKDKSKSDFVEFDGLDIDEEEENDMADIDSFNVNLVEGEMNGSHDEVPYLDRAYRGRIYEKNVDEVITLE